MSRAAAAAVLALVFAACFGASLLQQTDGRRATDPAARAPQTPRAQQQEPIDQRQVLELDAVRAPADTGERALTHAATIVGFGPRHSGKQPTEGWQQQLDYIVATLRQAGIAVERDDWTDAREQIAFSNVIATIPGEQKERLVLAAHHDTKCTSGHLEAEHNFPFVGANDGASGVAMLLALAPLLQQRHNRASIQLVFFDGEESLDWSWNGAARALFGSKRFVQQNRDGAEILGNRPRIGAMVLLDMVGRIDLQIQEELYSTAKLRQILWSAAVATGHRDRFFRRSETAGDDHVPFLEVGIPALDLIDLAGNPWWHTKDDTLQHLGADSLQIVAEVVLTMLPAIEREYFGDRH